MKQHVGTCSCGTTVIIQSDDAKEITIPRDHYDLLKEAAEEWSKEQTDNALHSLCVACKVLLDGYTPHRSNCRAARILGLKREVEK